jgi:hypothetical protein
VRCPALALQADAICGGALTDDDAQMLKQSIADCSVVRFAGYGHQMHWDATQKLMSVVAAFLESLSAFSGGTAPRRTSSTASSHAGNG